MKKLLPLLILSFSCGKFEAPNSTVINQFLSTAPVKISESDGAILSSICGAIALKNTQALINSDFTFTFFEKGCEASQETKTGSVVTRLVTTADGPSLVQGAVPFYFSNFETPETGTLASYCKNPLTIINPVTSGSDFIYLQVSDISGADCLPAPNEVCVQISRASASEKPDQAKVHTIDWIKFKINKVDGKVGFFTEKKRTSTAGCALSQSFSKRAVLTGP